MSLLSRPRSAAERLERIAVRPRMQRVDAVGRVGRLDGRSRVVAVRNGSGWHRSGQHAWTASSAARLRAQDVHEVLLRRRWHRARVLLAWLPAGMTEA